MRWAGSPPAEPYASAVWQTESQARMMWSGDFWSPRACGPSARLSVGDSPPSCAGPPTSKVRSPAWTTRFRSKASRLLAWRLLGALSWRDQPGSALSSGFHRPLRPCPGA